MKTIPHSRPTLSEDDARDLTRVIRSGQIASGRHVSTFESRFAKVCGVKEAAAVNSGTSALHLTLLALGIKRGDEVLIPAFTCSAVANAVRYTGAVPVCVDVEDVYFSMDDKDAARKCGRRTKALIAVHPFGFAMDLRPFKKLGVPLVEDGTQSPLAETQGRRVGTLGQAAVFSFYATKMMTTSEGGIIVSNSSALLRTVRDLRTYDKKADNILRYNYKMTDLQGALGCRQLKQLAGFIRVRRTLAGCYNEAFQRLPVHLPVPASPENHVYYRYIVRFDDKRLRDRCRKALLKKGIVCEPPVGQSLDQTLRRGHCRVSRRLVSHTLSLPLYPSLTAAERQRVVTAFQDSF